MPQTFKILLDDDQVEIVTEWLQHRNAAQDSAETEWTFEEAVQHCLDLGISQMIQDNIRSDRDAYWGVLLPMRMEKPNTTRVEAIEPAG